MFDFFIALFGGAYYTGKWLRERNKHIAYENEMTLHRFTETELRLRYEADYKLSQSIKEMILSGDRYDEICEKFEDDFEFVFGVDWKEKLRIPPQPPVLNPKDKYAYDISIPCNHIYWVYHLMLASEGKIDSQVFYTTCGLSDSGRDDGGMCIRFVRRIEERLIKTGVEGVKFVLKPNHEIYDREWCLQTGYRGGKFIIESLAFDPKKTCRLW